MSCNWNALKQESTMCINKAKGAHFDKLTFRYNVEMINTETNPSIMIFVFSFLLCCVVLWVCVSFTRLPSLFWYFGSKVLEFGVYTSIETVFQFKKCNINEVKIVCDFMCVCHSIWVPLVRACISKKRELNWREKTH